MSRDLSKESYAAHIRFVVYVVERSFVLCNICINRQFYLFKKKTTFVQLQPLIHLLE